MVFQHVLIVLFLGKALMIFSLNFQRTAIFEQKGTIS